MATFSGRFKIKYSRSNEKYLHNWGWKYWIKIPTRFKKVTFPLNIEVVTKRLKLFFGPLEKLQIQNLGTFQIEDVEIDDKLDMNFKPGLYREVQSFLGNK